MVPNTDILLADIETEEYADKTYCMDFEKHTISGFCDGREAIKQSIYNILSTERYKYPVYSWDYGTETEDLYGEPVDYVCSEAERRIKDALSVDERITSCDEFNFTTPEKHVLNVTFTANTIYGDVGIETEVDI